ncbi:hypothetical protein [uncultured Microscilla sp.]|uniref:hypothetical protein n=1 Tax=uncultured Microscilla sp. TaxID=432653 RepID=UPI0026017586|nr:hypothetical protein [uncultured Microscilla sp.]
MSREFNIDKIFREVADKHEEAYDPQDWNVLQGHLKANGLQAQPSVLTQVMRYIVKIISTAAVVYMMPASNQLNNTATPSAVDSKTITTQAAEHLTGSAKPLTHPNPDHLAQNNHTLTKNTHERKKETDKKILKSKKITQHKSKHQIVNKQKGSNVTPHKKRTPLQLNTPNKKARGFVKKTSKPLVTKQKQNIIKQTNINTKDDRLAKNTGNKNSGVVKKKTIISQSLYQVSKLSPIQQLDTLDNTTYRHSKHLAPHIDSISLHTHQTVLQAYHDNWTWVQRPRNTFQRVGRWLGISRKRRIPTPNKAKQVNAKFMAVDDSLKTDKPSKRKKKMATIRKVNQNKSLNLGAPTLRLNKLLSRLFFDKPNPTVAKSRINSLPKPAVYPIREAQLGFVYPLSTNGVDAHKYSNKLSINALIGSAAALDGLEFAGFGNIEKDYVKGAQFAGFFNTAGSHVQGLQAAGFFNNAGGALAGAQLAGFFNLAGVTNRSASRLAHKPTMNIQAAGFGNLNFNGSLNFQAAGFFNIGRQIDGFQGAGFLNISKEVNGFQASGFVGVCEKIHGAQISGFMNVADQVEGLQMAGLLNIAHKVKGSQIGFINIADSLTHGVPIGFLSIIKNGYRKFEIWGSESLHSNIGYKIGVRKFYNIFAVGAQFLPDKFRWGLGYGIGTIRNINAKSNFNFEAMVYHINENKFWEENLRVLNQVKFLYGREFSNGMSLQIGPTFNILVSQDTPESNVLASELPPYHFFDSTINGINLKLWGGLHLGLRF